MNKFIFFIFISFFSLCGISEDKIFIPFKELSEFQACYAFLIGTTDLEEKSMLKDWIEIKDFNCNKYSEVIFRAKIFGTIK